MRERGWWWRGRDAKDVGAMIGKIGSLGRGKRAAEAEGGGDAEEGGLGRVERGRDEDGAIVGKGNPATVEEVVEVGDEWKAVVGVEAFGVGGVSPRFGMGGAEKSRIGETGNGAGVPPEGEKAVAVDALPVAGENELFAIGGRGGRIGGRDGDDGEGAGCEVGKRCEDGGEAKEEVAAFWRVDGEPEAVGFGSDGPAGESGGEVSGWVEGKEDG